ncbi:T9SS type A sorting domain-containing protein [candidate division TA06 bacterium]|uniref:T9SS type A sorting domain-containing protein n=1 Tax=candidate division TA06 bacterium TaxID=2250710 RepID=A0A523UXJ7_UNCT6|nr:MAG: T9SS type A sorting domain-containing protein [candidate division TA06 bacterium]
MKRLLFVLVALLGSASFMCGSAFGWGSITGDVYDETTWEPLAGKYVHAYDEPGGTVIEWAVTDSLGNYTLYELEQGLYYVWVYGGENCASEWWEDTPDPEQADPIEVHDGETVYHIDFGLTCEADYGCITGRVTDEGTGQPINDAFVRVYTDPFGDPVADAFTNVYGHYEICELEQGIYFVHAHAQGCEGEWWDNQCCPGDADTVEVRAGQTTDHIDFALECEHPTGCITGRVVDQETEEPIHEAYVAIYSSPRGAPVAHTYTNEHGVYEICGLEPGIYYAFAHAYECEGEWYNNRRRPENADPIEVHGNQITDGINFSLLCEHPGTGCIVGRVTDEETGGPINDAFVRVYTDPFGDPVADAFTGIEGYYEICELEQGVYFVSAHAHGCDLEWYENKCCPREADSVEVRAGQTTDHIDFTLDCGEHTGCIVGRVTNEETGEPINDALVRIYTNPFGDPVAQGFTGWDGYYEICELEQGIYFVHAHARECDGEWYDNKSRPGQADSVEVRAGQTTDHIDFTLDCGPQNLCIWGRVVDEETGYGINDALVMAMMLDTSYAKYTFTNQYGHYEICELIPGEYVIFAHAGGYIGEFYDNVYRWEEATPVSPPEDGIDFSLGHRYHDNKMIKGKVYCGVDPAPGALVYAYSENATLGQEPVSSATTQEDGSYAIPGLSNGTYIITASRVNDPTTSYPVPVTIKNGDVNGIDIHLGATRVEESVVTRTSLRGMFLSATPNPFRDGIRLSYTIPAASMVKLQIFDLSGRLVATLVDETLGQGVYSAEWTPERLSSGLYISRLSCGEASLAQKIVFAR